MTEHEIARELTEATEAVADALVAVRESVVGTALPQPGEPDYDTDDPVGRLLTAGALIAAAYRRERGTRTHRYAVWPWIAAGAEVDEAASTDWAEEGQEIASTHPAEAGVLAAVRGVVTACERLEALIDREYIRGPEPTT